jgi:hypothetical protein
MKTTFFTLFTLFTLNLFSQSDIIYQVSEWDSKTVKKDESNEFKFENEELIITYDFWSGTREVSFSVYNKTDKAIIIDWTKSHFIIWNYSNDFFKGTESTYTSSNLQRSIYNNVSNSSSNSMTTVIKDKMETHIPPNSMVSENFKITNTLYFDCTNYFKKLKKDEVNRLDFSELNSPYKLRNYLTYVTSENKEKTIDNDFFINQVINMNKETFKGTAFKKETCNEFGKKSTKEYFPLPYTKSNRQYQTISLPNTQCCF